MGDNLSTNVRKASKPTYGGIPRKIYYAKLAWVLQFATINQTPATAEENTELQGTYVFKDGFKPCVLEIILKKGSVGYETLGDALISSAWKNMLKASIINNSPEADSFINEMNKPDSEYILWIPNYNDAHFRVFGDDLFPALRDAIKGGGSEKVEEGEVCEITLVSEGPKMRLYKGTLPGVNDTLSSDGDGIIQGQ